jgi:biotin carboxyl carrier protein
VTHVHPHQETDDPVRADDLDLVERLVVAPVAGVFFPAFTDVSAESPGMVAIGDEIGVLVQSGEKHPVTSPFTGELLGMLAQPGERLRMYQPIAWLTIADEM